METEVNITDDHLSASVSTRRRSHSVSDDYSVQRTNDDATQCKLAAVKLNYWEDPFLKRFASGVSLDNNLRRDPEISIGYWARVAAVDYFVEQFLEKTEGNVQIVCLGSGFDTLFFRLKSKGKKFSRFVDVDFSSVTAKKIKHIRKPGTPDVLSLFNEPLKESDHSDLHGGDYHLVGADLRQWGELKHKLDSTGLDYTVPTLFIAECVLVYMSADQSSDLLKKLAETFSTAVFVNYEQFRTSDTFSRVMEKNLEQRGIQLPGIAACESEDTQRKRFVNSGWGNVVVYDMNAVYKKILPADQVKRVESIEHLDEMELLSQLLHHYCFVHAVSDKTEKFASKLAQPDLS